MKVTRGRQNLISVVVLGLLLMLAMPGTAFGDNRDRNDRNRRGQNNEWNRHNRKCGKFVNCHDARSGRWDRRGPRRARINNRWRNRNRDNWAWQNRNRSRFDRNGRRLIVRRSNFR
ncbi:MAG: hypothetical protein H7Z16_07760 [Pyrinomonadaceae bacterium]|nr:hypothetical protein [Pyrinomonadaceae bacterium]